MDHYLRSTLHRIVGPDSFCLCIVYHLKSLQSSSRFWHFHIWPELSTTPTSKSMWMPWKRWRWSRTWRCWTLPRCCGGRWPRPPTTSDATTGSASTSTFWPSPRWGKIYSLQGEERARWETFLKWFSGASILPDLHSCGGSAQKKAHSLHCARPNSQHNTGLWRGKITDVTTRKNNNNNNIIRTATAQLSLGLNGTSWGKVANRSQTGLTGRVWGSGWWVFKLCCKPSSRSTSFTGRDHHEQCDNVGDKGHL